MTKLLGVLFIVAGVLAGLYVGVDLMLVGGIVEFINGVKANPTDASQIAWGVAKVFVLAELLGVLCFAVLAIPGVFLLTGDLHRSLRLGRR